MSRVNISFLFLSASNSLLLFLLYHSSPRYLLVLYDTNSSILSETRRAIIVIPSTNMAGNSSQIRLASRLYFILRGYFLSCNIAVSFEC